MAGDVLFEREFAQVNMVFWSSDQINELTEFSLVRGL